VDSDVQSLNVTITQFTHWHTIKNIKMKSKRTLHYADDTLSLGDERMMTDKIMHEQLTATIRTK